MDDASTTGPALSDHPLFAGYGSAGRVLPATADDHGPAPEFERLSRFGPETLETRREALPTQDVDWARVVELRRLASDAITAETEAARSRTGTPLTETDRLLLGRSLIRRIVGDHVRSLHRSGAELWSTAQEERYVQAVEDAVFRYGRLQPLLLRPDVENIEINGCNPEST